MTIRLVLLHGSVSEASQWSRYDELLPDVEVKAPDLPGHGSRISEPFTTDTALQTIDDAVADAKGPVIVAGHSLGGYMAMLYAARHQDRLAGLVLLGSSADPGSRFAVIYSGFAWLSQRLNRRALLKVRNAIASWLGAESNDLPEPDSYAVLPAAWKAVFDNCYPELMTLVDCPVLIINGQFDQMRLNERRFARLAGNANVVTIRWASHIAPMTHKEKVAAHLSAFIARLRDGFNPAFQ